MRDSPVTLENVKKPIRLRQKKASRHIVVPSEKASVGINQAGHALESMVSPQKHDGCPQDSKFAEVCTLRSLWSYLAINLFLTNPDIRHLVPKGCNGMFVHAAVHCCTVSATVGPYQKRSSAHTSFSNCHTMVEPCVGSC